MKVNLRKGALSSGAMNRLLKRRCLLVAEYFEYLNGGDSSKQ